MEAIYVGSYKVVKVYRNSQRREVLRRNLTREEAMRIVNLYPSRSRSIMVFMKQFSAAKYFKQVETI